MTHVLIVGAGPTGLALANELAKHKINFRIIDQATTACQQSRAIAVQARTLELFERFGQVTEQLVQQGVPLRAGKIFSAGDLLAQIDLSKINSRYPFALSLPQYDTEAVLCNYLNQQGIKVETGSTLSAFNVAADQTIDAEIINSNHEKENIQVDYLIACDGAHSMIRKQLKLEFAGTTYIDQTFLLADVKFNRPFINNELQVFVQQGEIVACFPLPNEHFRLIAEQPKGKQVVDINRLQTLIHQLVAPDLNIEQVSWFSEFRINQRKVKTYQVDHIFLVGDAAHIHSPVGGQGMNTGMQDAINLGWKLAMVLNKQATPALLASYATERSHVGNILLRNTNIATRMMMLRENIFIKVRNWLLSKLTKSAMVQHKIINTISELAINYRKIGLSQENFSSHHDYSAGNRWPDGDVETNQQTSRWYQLLATDRFNLLVVGADSALYDELASKLAPYQAKLQWFGLTHDNQITNSNPNILWISDPNYAWQNKLTKQEPAIYLIRPDFYIAYRAAPLELLGFSQYLEQYLIAD